MKQARTYQNIKHSFLAVLALASALMIATPTLAAPMACSKVFAPNIALERHALIQTRAMAIVEHQNHLRAEIGLPLFEPKDYLPNLKKRPPENITSDTRYIVVKEHLVLIEMTDKMASTALLTDDVHSLNYVYRFEGPRLVEAIPASIYYISQMPEVVRLTRGLSLQERALWKNGDFNALRTHPKAIKWGYPEPVAHFSVKIFQPLGTPLIEGNFPREVLLNWAKRGLITIGSEGDAKGKPDEIEIVIHHRVWEEVREYLKQYSF